MTASVAEIVFDPLDAVRLDEADELLNELREAGLQADVSVTETKGVLEVAAIVALITLATTTVAGLSIVVAFLHRTFDVGVVVDASKGRVRVHKDPELPRGSVLTIPRTGEPVLKYNVSGDALRTLMSSILRGAESTAG